MGDRWNINNDEIEARRYREEVPLHWRLVYGFVDWGKVLVPLAAAIGIGLWLRSTGLVP